jgi:RNA polymerase sigma factor (sigma-70 family)
VTDADLVSKVLAGSQDAARRLVEQHQQAVYNLVCRMVRDPGVAEELAQDAFAKAFAALRSFNPAYRLVSWLLRIAQNTAIDYLRRVRPETMSLDEGEGSRLPESVLEDARQASPEQLAQRADLGHALASAIDRLRPEYRRLVVLRYQEDQSYEEIAALLDLPLGTVKSHLHRARRELARLMADSGWGPRAPGADKGDATRRGAGT